jgi:hypothetical protein
MPQHSANRLRNIIQRAVELELPLGPLGEPHVFVRGGKTPKSLLHLAHPDRRCAVTKRQFGPQKTAVRCNFVEAVNDSHRCDCIDLHLLRSPLDRYTRVLANLSVATGYLSRLEAEPDLPRWVLLAEVHRQLFQVEPDGRSSLDHETLTALADSVAALRNRYHQFGPAIARWYTDGYLTGIRPWTAQAYLNRIAWHHNQWGPEEPGEHAWYNELIAGTTPAEYQLRNGGAPAAAVAANVARWHTRLDQWTNASLDRAVQLVIPAPSVKNFGFQGTLQAAVLQFGLVGNDRWIVLDTVPGVVFDVLQNLIGWGTHVIADVPLTKTQAEVFLALWQRPDGIEDIGQAVAAARLCA